MRQKLQQTSETEHRDSIRWSAKYCYGGPGEDAFAAADARRRGPFICPIFKSTLIYSKALSYKKLDSFQID